MKKLKTAVVSMFVCAVAATCFAACSDDKKPEEPKTLAAPEIVLNDDFSVSWEAVNDATAYVVNVNGDDLKAQQTLTFDALTAVNTYTVKVKAKNDEAVSDYSTPVTYSVFGVTLAEGEGYELHGAATVYGGRDYSFTLTLAGEAYEGSVPVVKANDEVLTEADGKYTVTNVSSALNIMVEGVAKRTFAVSIPSGDGYTVTGESEATYGEDYSFTVAKNAGYDQSALTVKVNGEAITEENGKYTVKNVKTVLNITVEGAAKNQYAVTLPSSVAYTIAGAEKAVHGEEYSFTLEVTGIGNVYTLSNITGDVTLTVKVYDLAAQFALNVNAAATEADGVITIAAANIQISSAYVKKLTDAGYTHMKFSIDVTNGDDILICHSGTWNKYYRVLSISGDTARIDLTEFTDEENAYAINIEGRGSSSASLAVSEITLYKSAETVKWTKSNSNIYCAEEDGFIVLETRAAGNDAHILSSTEWWAKYANNSAAGNASQRTIILSGKYLYAGGNSRGALWGGASAAVSSVGGTANTEIVTEYMNNVSYAEGNQFYYGLEREGVYALKVNEFVSNRNSWGGFSYAYADETTFTVTLFNEGKIVNVNTQDYIAKGYTKCVITAGEYTGGQIWVGNDNWSGGMFGLDSGKSKELDLTMFTENNPYLQIYCSNDTATGTTVRITCTFSK